MVYDLATRIKSTVAFSLGTLMLGYILWISLRYPDTLSIGIYGFMTAVFAFLTVLAAKGYISFDDFVRGLETISSGYSNSGYRYQRRSLSSWDKQMILKMQNYRCAICGNRLKPELVEYDHIVPLALGGEDSIENIQALCPECHRIKTKRDRNLIAEAKRTGKSRRSLIDEYFEGINRVLIGDTDEFFGAGQKTGRKKRARSKRRRPSKRDEDPFEEMNRFLWGDSRSRKRKRRRDGFDLF